LVLAASQCVIACGDDDDSSSGTGGVAAKGGASALGGASTGSGGGTIASGGKSAGGAATSGGKSAGAGGSAASGGAAGDTNEGGTGGSDVNAGGAGGHDGLNIVETALAAGQFKQLTAALTSAGLVETLQGEGPFTVFAPDDAAFAAFEAANPGVLAGLSKADLSAVLTYHVVPGAAVSAAQLKDDQVFTTVSGSPLLVDKGTGVKLTDGIKADDASVKVADIVASNGIIHVIDFVIRPPAKDIVETAVAAGSFTSLVSAVTTAGLAPTLSGPGPFTVFAPTDAAFSGVTPPSGAALVNLLKFHVVGAAAGSGDLSNGAMLTTLDTATTTKLTVDLGNGVSIKDSTATAAKVAPANILAKNGVIHVVDKVLIPQ
jgi:uncharacterized surface protein with fasciclin (FAS1) repeats